MKLAQFRFGIFLVSFACVVGCATQTPDPLAGWQFRPFPGWGPDPNGHNDNKLAQAITDDYEDFIAKNKLQVAPIKGFYENGLGQHAVGFTVCPSNQNATWNYALIYDGENKRIKTIKYGYHRYRS
jgi:hypothetical protein